MIDETWRDSALCAQTDPELFFPPPGGSPAPARRICAKCPVKQQCLEWALAQEVDPDGIWGGTSAQRRRQQMRPKKPRIAECGTTAGFSRHYRDGEKPCNKCYAANRAYRRNMAARKRWKATA